MSNPFEGRTIVVTGGTGALGTAVVGAFLEAGASVHVPAIESEIDGRFGHDNHPRCTVVTGVALEDEAQAKRFYGRTPSPWASIHLAGGFAMAPLADIDGDSFDAMWRMNVRSCFLSCREAVVRMREGGCSGGDGGRIVNVAARPALVPTGGMLAYATAKGAVAALTRALAEELADEKIWVNAIAPSIIDTPANRRAMPKADHARWPSTAEIARVIVDLASPANACVRGAIVPVFGRS